MNMVAAMAYLAADAIVRTLPRGIADAIATRLARAAFSMRVPARQRLERNLERLACEPVERRAQALETFEQFALSVTDFLRLAHVNARTLRARTIVRGETHLDEASRSCQGTILVSVHAGCVEWGAAYLSHLGKRLRVVARPHASRTVEALFRARRAAWGVGMLDGRPLWREAARALRRGEWVALMGDRALPDSRASLCTLAAALARRTGARVLPIAMTRRHDGRHVIWCDPALDAAECRGDGVATALRRHLRRARGQWFAFRPAPEGLA